MSTRGKLKSATPARQTSALAAPVERIVDNAVGLADPDDDARSERGGGVQSIARAFSILEEVARNREGIGLADLSKRVGLHNSTTFHLVKTMVSLGYIRQLKDSKRYRVGRPLFALASSALDEIEMVSMATPVLENLARATGEASHFAARMDDTVVIIARTPGPGAFQLTDRAGVVRPAYCTALGKVILAALRPEQFERYLERVELNPLTDNTITDPQRLRKEIEEIRRSGIAFDDGELNGEVRCAAVPVRDFSGQVAGAIGISGPVWRLSIQMLQSHAQSIANAADELSNAFGATGLFLSMFYFVVARGRPKPGERAKVEALLRQLTEAVRTEPGNLGFVVHRLREDADEFLLYETYKDEAAFLAHREMTHFKNLVVAEAVPRLERRVIQAYALLD